MSKCSYRNYNTVCTNSSVNSQSDVLYPEFEWILESADIFKLEKMKISFIDAYD